MLTAINKAVPTLLAGLLLLLCGRFVFAVEEGWYLGVGYGYSYLDPEVPFDIFESDDKESRVARVVGGYDFSPAASLELVLSHLGEAEMDNQSLVEYSSADVVGLYRFYDRSDLHPGRNVWSPNLFVKLGLGYLNLETDIALENESRIHMLAGLGAEFPIFGGLSLRAAVEFIDSDALAGHLSLIKRFSFDRRSPPARNSVFSSPSETLPDQQASAVAEDEQPPRPDPEVKVPQRHREETETPPPIPDSDSQAPTDPDVKKTGDFDADGVPDSRDACLNSADGYPVRADGCPLLNGILSNIRFEQYSSVLNERAKANLRGLAKILNQYPKARIQLSSHTAALRSEREQVDLTRDRLREIARYLQQLNVKLQQVQFIAYGARAPVSAGKPAERIEIKERR